jgi:serine kinase of HPr protein (carbohydrate metabolism regulator)
MAQPSSETRHASTIAIDGQAIMITGVSGSGKSDLALRLIDRGARLVSDDYTLITRTETGLMASAPSRLKGKLEVRGIGIIECEAIDQAPVALLVRLGPVPERMPAENDLEMIAGCPVPAMSIAPFEASAPIKVEWALRRLSDTH